MWLRPIERKDIPFLREMHNHPSTLEFLTDPMMVNEVQQEGWFERVSTSRTSFRLAVLNSSQHIVGCTRWDHYDQMNKSVQIGGDIHHSFRGRKFGKGMLESSLQYGFDILNCHRLCLSTLETNKIAINLYRSVGMKEEGRSTDAILRGGQYHDLLLFYMTEDMYRKE